MKHFGIQLVSNYSEKEALDIAARLFLNPYITAAQANLLISAMERGRLSMETFLKKTEVGINDLLSWNETIVPLHKLMSNKLKDWIQVFGTPTKEDYDFVKEAYGFSMTFLFGDKPVIDVHCAKDMADYVKQYVKGQDRAIEQLSVPFFLHLDSKRKQYTSMIKTPVIVMGPTGIGKSEALRLFGQLCDCPVVRINTSEVVPSGWRGLHISDILCREITNMADINDLQYAVIIFHEFDKITHYGQLDSSSSRNWDADMMRDIMRLFEKDHDLFLEAGFDKDTMAEKSYRLPVDNLLIVFDGAFQGIESIIKRRLNIASRIDASSAENKELGGVNVQSLVSNEDLETWGYMPELLGRIGDIIVMNPLSANVIYQIITSARGNILSHHIDFCSNNNIDLRFTDEALHFIADEAAKSGLGFRNVKAIISKAMNQIYYEMPVSSVTDQLNQTMRVLEISKDYILRSL